MSAKSASASQDRSNSSSVRAVAPARLQRQDRLPGRLLRPGPRESSGLFAEALRHPRVVGTAAALADRRHGRVGPADTGPDDGVLRQRHQQDGRRHLLALQLPRQALAIPALVDLAQADDERLVEAQPAGQPLRHLAVAGEALGHQSREREQAAGDQRRHAIRRLAGARLPQIAHGHAQHLGRPTWIDCWRSRAGAPARHRTARPWRRCRRCSRCSAAAPDSRRRAACRRRGRAPRPDASPPRTSKAPTPAAAPCPGPWRSTARPSTRPGGPRSRVFASAAAFPTFPPSRSGW